MQIEDDRNDEQRAQLSILVIGTDTFMSGWGLAKGGVSYAAWATDEAHLSDTLAWVERRKDLKRVRVVYGSYKPRGQGHLHIYVSNYCKAKE